MAIQYKLSLWWKNIRGAFVGGFQGPNNRSEGITLPNSLLMIGHALTFLVSITFGAVIKTLFDICTRKPLPSENISKAISKVNQLDKEQLRSVCKAITDSKPSSLSSRQLCDTLRDLDIEQEEQVNSFINEELKMQREKTEGSLHGYQTEEEALLQKSNLMSTGSIKFCLNKQVETKENEKEALKREKSKEISMIATIYSALKKDTLKRYLNSPTNNGKKTHSLLSDTLEKEKNKEQEEDSEENSKENIEFIGFEDEVTKQVTILRESTCRGNTKANQIQNALDKYRSNRNANNYIGVIQALKNERDIPLTGMGYKYAVFKRYRHAESFNKVFFQAMDEIKTDEIRIYPLKLS